MARILVVDDEPSMRELLEIMLRKHRHDVSTAATLDRALARVAEDEPDLVISDLRLGNETGLKLLESVKARTPATEVVMITAFATTENAVQAMKMGAYDYVLKPFKLDELQLVVDKALEHRRLLAENRLLRHRVGERADQAEPLLGRTEAIEQIRQVVAKVGPTRSTVLITGESGTGKEVVARLIHAAGDPDRPFVAINCGAIPEGLIESEFFGHERGAFTGAIERRAGLFEVAGSGTLFLDEIGELSLPLQVKLLRALQDRRIRRVGGSADIVISARIVAATNRDLSEDVRAGRFREDLFYRLNVIQIRVPPLRDRRPDIPEFCSHFVRRIAAEMGRPEPSIGADAMRLLTEYAYPGNLRELWNVLERALTLATGPEISPEVLPPTVRGGTAAVEAAAPQLPADGMDLQAHLDAVERRILEQALARAGGVKTEAARLLSLTFRSLRYRLAKYGIDGP